MITVKAKFKQLKEMKSANKLIFHTKEDVPELDRLQYTNDEGYLVFHVDEIKKTVIKAIEDKRPAIIDNSNQTYSQRQRGLLFQVFAAKYPQYELQNTPEAKAKWGEAYASYMNEQNDKLRAILNKLRST